MKLHRSAVLCLLRLLLAIFVLWASAQVYEPLLMAQRTWLVGATLLLALVVFAWELHATLRLRMRRALRSGIAVLILGSSLLGLLHTAQQGMDLWWTRAMILRTPPQAMRELGQHLVVGYTSLEEVRHLAGEGMIGGIYITQRNIAGRSPAQIREEVAALQQLRHDKRLPPLWVAADQEGGMVSHLSPPLPLLAPLSQIVKSLPDAEQRSQAIFTYAALQGRQLASLGVNVNLAPVVDVNHGISNPDDRHSRISERAISADPEVVRDVAAQFCAGLAQNNVRCTLKHFPGLGAVYADTHQDAAELATPLVELQRSDWIPFRALMNRPGILTMVGHARLLALDAELPASFSAKVIGMLRQQWEYNGILITDDFCMGAVHGSPAGVGGAAVRALNAGADLILVSFDPSQYYPVMRALLRAQAEGRLDQGMLDASARRLGTTWATADRD